MCPWWYCKPGFRVAIGDVVTKTMSGTFHPSLNSPLGHRGRRCWSRFPLWAEDCHSPALLSPRSCLQAHQLTTGNNLKINKSIEPSTPPHWLLQKKNFTSENRAITTWMLYSHASNYSRHVLTFKLVVNKISQTSNESPNKSFSASKCPAITAQCWWTVSHKASRDALTGG